ncbi:MAG: hypothetical protein II951_08450 [Bacteroidales bacterium]|nr:hypothetical protein [Bacteroidales bacterium]
MGAGKYIIAIIVLFIKIGVLNAQVSDYYTDSVAYDLLNKCIKKRRVYPKYKYKKDYFKDVKLHTIPLCTIVNDSLQVLHGVTPYLIVISKDDKYVGVIDTDDKGNSYIDVDFRFKYILKMWPIWRLIESGEIWICNVAGINETIVFTYHDNKIKRLNVEKIPVNDRGSVSIDSFIEYIEEYQYPEPLLYKKDADQNSWWKLREYLRERSIAYD